MFQHVKQFQTLDKIEDSVKLGQMMMNHKLLVPLMRDPRFKEEEKKKYPKHLYPAKGGALRMNDKGFYFWQVEKSTGKHAFFLVMLVVVMITFLLFNIWPLWLKIGLWYFSFYTLVILVIKYGNSYRLALLYSEGLSGSSFSISV